MDLLSKIHQGQDQFLSLHLKYLNALMPQLSQELIAKNPGFSLDPLLFSYFYHLNRKDKSKYANYLEGIISGYLEDLPNSIIVYSNSVGEIYLPEVGYFFTNKPNSEFELVSNSDKEFQLLYKNQHVEFSFESINKFSGNLELQKSIHPLMEFLFTRNDLFPHSDDLVPLSEIEIRKISGKKEKYFPKAIQIIKKYFPEYWKLMDPVFKRVLVFNHQEMRPFAATFNHGTALICTHEHDSLPFFIVEFVHQIGHNMLNAILFSMRKYFRINPHTPLSKLNGNPQEGRSFFSAFHGLFTTTKVAECLETMLNVEGVFSPTEKHELLARFIDNRRRLRTGLEKIDFKATLTDEGIKLYEYLDTSCFEIYEKNKSICDQYDISNQPFVFSYKKFLEANPLLVTS